MVQENYSTSTVNKQVLFKADPGAGWVNADDHLQIKYENFTPPVLQEGEILVKNLILSLDP